MSSQDFTYGVLFGINSIDVESKGTSPIFDNDAPGLSDGYHIGVFIDYQLNDFFGIKGDFIHSSVKEGYRIVNVSEAYDLKKNTFQLNTHIKYDLNSEYNKGFYILAGPRVSFFLSAEDDNKEDVKDFYKNISFGAQLGFGVGFLKHYSFELIGDHGFTNPVDIDNLETTIINIRFSLSINLESIFNN